MSPSSRGDLRPGRLSSAQEQFQNGKLVFQRMTKYMSFRNVKAWEDLRQEISQRTLAFILTGIVLAYGLSLTSHSVWTNFPIAVVLLLLLRRLSFNYEIRWSPDYHPDCCTHKKRPAVPQVPPGGPMLSFDLPKLSKSAAKRHGSWKAGIDSPAVEAAVDTFTRAIVREWVTNLWYRLVTPDDDFPEELRLLINRAVAGLAVRVQKANLITLLTRDLVDLFGHHLEVYRQVRDQIGHDVLDALSISDQDEHLSRAMLQIGELHVGLTSPQAEYRVLRRLMGGVVTSALRPEEVHCRLLRVVAREILASAVMRPLMNLITPALLNELILAVKGPPKGAATEGEVAPPEERAKSEPSGEKAEGVMLEQGSKKKAGGDAGASFGADDVAKFEKKKAALAAEHWDQMWVGAKGKRQRALADERKRRAREAGGVSGDPKFGEDEKVRGSQCGGMSPLGSSTASLSAFGGEEGEQSLSPLRPGSGDVHGVSGGGEEPAVPGIGWDKDEWENLILETSAQLRSATIENSENVMGVAATCRKEQIKAGQVVEREAIGAASLKTDKAGAANARKKGGLSNLDANSMGLNVAPKAPPAPKGAVGSATELKLPLLSVSSDGTVPAVKPPPLSTRSENGQPRDRPWIKQGGSSSWNEVVEGTPRRHLRRSLSGGLEGLVSEEAWGDVDADVSDRRSSLEERSGDLESGAMRRTLSEQLWEGVSESAPTSPHMSGLLPSGGGDQILARVVGARMEESEGKAFAVYTIAVADSDRSSWLVQRRYRNFEALHRRLKDFPQYKLKLPPKRFLNHNLDGSFVLERRAQLDKYLRDLLAVPRVAESHEVWDFLSADSHAYGFSGSSSMMKTLAGNMDDMFRRLNEVSDELQGAISKGLKKAPTLTETLSGRLSKQKTLARGLGATEVAMADQTYRGMGSPEAFVEVQRIEEDEGEKVDGQVLGWAPMPSKEGLFAVQPGTREDGLASIESDFSADVTVLLKRDPPERRDAKAVAKEGEAVLSGTDSPRGGDDSVEEGEEIPLPQEWHASKLSGPLLNLVDNVFQLQQHGWLRRQVVWIARQILEIGLGDAIDDFILTKIQWLRQPEVVAVGIHGVRNLLWPNGVWFANQQEADTCQQQRGRDDKSRAPAARIVAEQARRLAKEGDPAGSVNRGGGSSVNGLGGPRVNSEGEVEWDWNPPQPQLSFEERLEVARKAALVRELFLDRAPAALVSLIGSKQYKKCARDVYNFLQSPLCVKQLAYGVLEILIKTTFPELKALVHEVRTDGALK